AAAQPSIQAARRPFGVREPEVGHPAGDELVELADAVSHRHAPAPPGQPPQPALQPLDRLGATWIVTCGPLKENPNPGSVASAACRIEDFSRFTFSLSRRSITSQTLPDTLWAARSLRTKTRRSSA